MLQPLSGTDGQHRRLQISEEDLVSVKEFEYLGSTTTYDNKLGTELQLRKHQASQAFGHLKDRIWLNRDLTIKTKCAVYRVIV